MSVAAIRGALGTAFALYCVYLMWSVLKDAGWLGWLLLLLLIGLLFPGNKEG